MESKVYHCGWMKREGYNTDMVAVAHSGFYVHCDRSFIGLFCPITKQELIEDKTDWKGDMCRDLFMG